MKNLNLKSFIQDIKTCEPMQRPITFHTSSSSPSSSAEFLENVLTGSGWAIGAMYNVIAPWSDHNKVSKKPCFQRHSSLALTEMEIFCVI